MFFSRQKQTTISITQKAEIVVQRKLIGFLPLRPNEGRYQQQQCALGLVEVGDESFHDFHLVSGCDHQCR